MEWCSNCWSPILEDEIENALDQGKTKVVCLDCGQVFDIEVDEYHGMNYYTLTKEDEFWIDSKKVLDFE